jgi:hypothetical protein
MVDLLSVPEQKVLVPYWDPDWTVARILWPLGES